MFDNVQNAPASAHSPSLASSLVRKGLQIHPNSEDFCQIPIEELVSAFLKYLLYSLYIIVKYRAHVWANTSPGFTFDECRVSNSEGAELELHFLSSHIKYFRFLGWNWKRRRVLLQRRGGVWAWALCSANKRSLFGSEDGDRDTIFHWQPPHHSLLSTNIGNVLSSKWLNVLRCWKISWKCQITAELSSVQWLDVLIPIAV